MERRRAVPDNGVASYERNAGSEFLPDGVWHQGNSTKRQRRQFIDGGTGHEGSLSWIAPAHDEPDALARLFGTAYRANNLGSSAAAATKAKRRGKGNADAA